MATELERAGLRLQGDPLWSARALIERPELIAAVHLAYARAGADILTSASYQATIPGLVEQGFTAKQARDCLKLSVALARQACHKYALESMRASSSSPLVAGGIGPYGAYLADGSEYTGRYNAEPGRLRDFHLRQIEVLLDTDVDILACESIPSLHEGEVLANILAEIPEMAAWVSFTCPDHEHVSYGNRLRDCVDLFQDKPHVLTGINCVKPTQVRGLIASVKDRYRSLKVVYANKGEVWDPDTLTWQETSGIDDQSHIRLAQDWIRQGIWIVGGCCRTTPDFIQALVSMRQSLGPVATAG